jgi:hypothetical protein
MFNSWLWRINKDLKQLALRATSICWAIWRLRNDIVFERKNAINSLQVLHSTTQWLRTWVVLQKLIFQELILNTCQRLEQVAELFFHAHG